MRIRNAIVALAVLGATIGCARTSPPPEPPVAWGPSRVAVAQGSPGLAGPTTARPPLGKFSLRFYQKLRARPAIAPLAEVDVWDLRHHPRQVDVITIGPVAIREWSGRMELLDHLAATHGLTREKAEVLTNWVRSGGVVWVEFGVFVQGHEWALTQGRRLPPLPDLSSFKMFGLPTRSFMFEARRTGAFRIEPAIITVRNEAQHEATSDVRTLKLVQAEVKTVYTVLAPEAGQALVREGDRVYATVASLGQGRIVSTLPFDRWDVETDGEKYRINLAEWLAGYAIPAFDPQLDVERARD